MKTKEDILRDVENLEDALSVFLTDAPSDDHILELFDTEPRKSTIAFRVYGAAQDLENIINELKGE